MSAARPARGLRSTVTLLTHCAVCAVIGRRPLAAPVTTADSAAMESESAMEVNHLDRDVANVDALASDLVSDIPMTRSGKGDYNLVIYNLLTDTAGSQSF